VHHTHVAHGKSWGPHASQALWVSRADVQPAGGPSCRCRAPSLPCARYARRTAKVWAHMPVRHCGRRPTAGGWQVGRSLPCASPMRRTTKAGLGTMDGRWARLYRAPDPRGARHRLWGRLGLLFVVRRDRGARQRPRQGLTQPLPDVSSPDAPT
jgi:hypothetical protein